MPYDELQTKAELYAADAVKERGHKDRMEALAHIGLSSFRRNTAAHSVPRRSAAPRMQGLDSC